MKLPEEVLELMVNEAGIDINSPKSFYSLSMDIYNKTKENLSENTLRRMFGIIADGHIPHRHTLDVVGRYLGHPDWKSLMEEVSPENSDFSSTLVTVSPGELKPGQVVDFTYEPGRRVRMSLQEDGMFKVVSSVNSKIKSGDIVRFSSIALHFPFIASEVVRDGVSLGRFVAGERLGVTSIKIR